MQKIQQLIFFARRIYTIHVSNLTHSCSMSMSMNEMVQKVVLHVTRALCVVTAHGRSKEFSAACASSPNSAHGNCEGSFDVALHGPCKRHPTTLTRRPMAKVDLPLPLSAPRSGTNCVITRAPTTVKSIAAALFSPTTAPIPPTRALVSHHR